MITVYLSDGRVRDFPKGWSYVIDERDYLTVKTEEDGDIATFWPDAVSHVIDDNPDAE